MSSPESFDVDAVPAVELSRASVPLTEVVFETPDGRSVPLSGSSPELAGRLMDSVPPIYRPRFGGASSLVGLEDGDLVVGYAAGETAYAFPLTVLERRELVNAEVEGVPVLVSYCACGQAAVYRRELNARVLVFGNTSALYASSRVVFDHQTGSYWLQRTGGAVVGRLTGTRLAPLPSQTLSWGEWKRRHPGTRVLVGDGDE